MIPKLTCSFLGFCQGGQLVELPTQIGMGRVWMFFRKMVQKKREESKLKSKDLHGFQDG